jgi:hypothetical protein
MARNSVKQLAVTMTFIVKIFEQDTGLDAQSFFDRFYHQTDFLPAIEKYAPDLLEEVRGIAEGSGRSFDETLARQLSDEDPWFRQIVKFGRPVPENCSSLGTCETETQFDCTEYGLTQIL